MVLVFLPSTSAGMHSPLTREAVRRLRAARQHKEGLGQKEERGNTANGDIISPELLGSQ